MKTKDPNLIKTPKENVSSTKAEDKIDAETIVNKGTVTLENEQFSSEHVNELDNPARQPDRRDQQDSTENLANSLNSDKDFIESNKSEDSLNDEITDANKYATIDNAQKRVLNEDLKD